MIVFMLMYLKFNWMEGTTCWKEEIEVYKFWGKKHFLTLQSIHFLGGHKGGGGGGSENCKTK